MAKDGTRAARMAGSEADLSGWKWASTESVRDIANTGMVDIYVSTHIIVSRLVAAAQGVHVRERASIPCSS